MRRGAHRGTWIPLFLPTPTHRESHGDSLNVYSHPANGMKISPTEVFGGKLGGGKRKTGKGTRSTHVCQGGPQRASSNRMGTGMLPRRRTSDTKLLLKYSVYSNSEIQYKNRDIY